MFYDLERPTGRAALEATQEIVLSAQTGLVVIYEAQRLPSLFAVLRPPSDDPSVTAGYLLPGSVSPNIVRDISGSLAGRAYFIQIPGCDGWKASCRRGTPPGKSATLVV